MKLYWTIVLSLILHMLLMASLQMMPPRELFSSYKPLEITILNTENTPSKQKQNIVRDLELNKLQEVKENQDPTKFLSAQTFRVKEQTQAAEIGKTKNRSSESTIFQKKQSSQKLKELEKKLQEKLQKLEKLSEEIALKKQQKKSEEDLNSQAENNSKEIPRPSLRGFNETGYSTVGESLSEDIKVGSFTSLNTDRYLFYTFFARIEDQVRYRWESRVRYAIEHINSRTINSSNSNWSTQIEVSLNPKGEFISAVVMKESGIKSFDYAATDAFKEAGIFPNPPKELIDQDNIIRLKYRFNVHHDPRTLVFR